MAHLKILYSGEEKEEHFPLEGKDVFTIGRSQDADIKVMDIKVSRNHCRIEGQDNEFVITDLKSRNGTFVNGEKIASVKLKPGDHIKVGFSVLQYFDDETVPAVVPPSDGLAAEIPGAPPAGGKIRRCYFCGKVLDDMDFIGGMAKSINDRDYCQACSSSVPEAGGALVSESPAQDAPSPPPSAPEPAPAAPPAPEPAAAPPEPDPEPPKPGGKLIDFLDDEDDDNLLPGDDD